MLPEKPITPKQRAFLKRVESGERFTWAETGRYWRLVGRMLEPYFLTPDEAEAQGIATPEECREAKEHGLVFMEIGQKMPRFRIRDEWRHVIEA